MSKDTLEKLIKETVDQIILDFVDGDPIDELHIYDFDDTLVRTNSTIFIVNTQTGERRELHPHEFHEYHLRKNEMFDLEDFDIVEEAILLPHFEKFKSDYKRLGNKKVAILTARPYPHAVYSFLKKHKMADVVIKAVGEQYPTTDVRNVNAARKADWIRLQLRRFPIRHLSFYDDNFANINAAQKLKAEFPHVNFNIELVLANE